ncbi:daptide-type RiPP biosynthesis aminotransferase [Motilibacter aurantiacus]|uniref:daptide-type RiPP biosynthesis aminotransferase n=1 Tax=Motilibacter aurantiacus TaxID=2714955 RepID=UPI002F2B4DC8
MTTNDRPLWEFLVPPSAYGDPSRTAVRASGVRVAMADGSTLLCGTSGLWNVNFGYGNPAIAEAVHAALLDASYLSLFRYGHEYANRAAGALLDAAGPEAFGRVLFSTSGSAANDTVMKLVRQYAVLRGERGRKLVVGLRGSYHGLTYGSSALTGEDLGQELYGVDRRLVRHVSPHDVEELRALCAREGERIAALVLEPVLGTGAIEVPDAFVAAAGRLADEHGFALVADEVATGFHRTGPFRASAAWARQPDLVVLSKGLTNGTCAASAIVIGRRVVEAFDAADAVFVHGETQAGTPPTAAAILATLQVARETVADGRVEALARRLDAGLQALAAAAGGRVRLTGRGLFRGLVVSGRDGLPLDGPATAALVAETRRAGAIVHNGLGGIQLLPALTYSDAEIDELLGCLADGLSTAQGVCFDDVSTVPQPRAGLVGVR